MADSGPARGVDWFHRGEVVVVARVPRERLEAVDEMQRTVHASLRAVGGPHVREEPSSLRSFAFTAPGRRDALVFLFQKLAVSDSPSAVKATVEALHERLDAIGDAHIDAISAMPHWHTRAHEAYSGGSPDAVAKPVYLDQVRGERYGYRAVQERLDFSGRPNGQTAVRIAILDTAVNLSVARQRAAEFRDRARNDHMQATLDWLGRSPGSDHNPELEMLEAEHGLPQAAAGQVADHGLFIAGLIHAIAPTAPLTLYPVLSGRGLGDLSSLLVGLQRVLAEKDPLEPCIVNVSLGFLPHPARLPAAWHGLSRPNDSGYVLSTELSDHGHDQRWATAHRGDIDECMILLQLGLRELGTYLRLNNCLVVAAAGNDSQSLVESHAARMAPRLPARLGSVLGVAATAKDPSTPAPYSNMGDETELGDHVATFGGVQTSGPEPEIDSAMVGIYSGEFADGRPNETGWATWSGTSFATAIVSGVASNYWSAHASEEPLHASEVLADLHADARELGPYVAALRTPSIAVRGEWQRG